MSHLTHYHIVYIYPQHNRQSDSSPRAVSLSLSLTHSPTDNCVIAVRNDVDLARRNRRNDKIIHRIRIETQERASSSLLGRVRFPCAVKTK